jgi:RNA polymerase sigma-70 factor (ECF subfamily)
MKIIDEKLVALSLCDPRYFNFLIERHRRNLLEFITRAYVGDEDVAEDIVQEAFIRAFLKLRSFDPQKKWRTWLYQIAINRAKTLISKPAYDSIHEREIAVYCLPEEQLDRKMAKEWLKKIMSRMLEEQRVVLELYYFEQLSLVEISRRIKMPVPLVRNRIRYAEKMLALKGYIEV